jgi:polysaccharide pyruvyl transferase CsaB
MKRTHTLIAGYYGFGNAGDELILQALIERYRLQDPASPVIACSGNPDATRADFGIEAVNRWNFAALIARMLHAKRFVLGGGGLLQESSGPFNHLYYLTLLLLAKICGCRTETLGLGVDPVRYALNRWLTGWVFNHVVDRIVVRDKGSMRVLRSCVVDRTIECHPDLVFDLSIAERISENSTRVAIAVSDWSAQPGWDQDLAVFCQALQDRLGAEIDLIPFFPNEDAALATAVANQTRATLRVRNWSKPEDLTVWTAEYGLVIGMRFHALVLASKAKVPFIGWGQQPKVRQFCVDQGAPFWDFDRGWNLESVLRQIEDTWERRVAKPAKKVAPPNLVYSRRTH